MKTTNGILLRCSTSNVSTIKTTFYSFEYSNGVFYLFYFRSSDWTRNALVLPGNKVNISLETATNYAHDTHANNFGFKCLIIGYDNPALVSEIAFSYYKIFIEYFEYIG